MLRGRKGKEKRKEDSGASFLFSGRLRPRVGSSLDHLFMHASRGSVRRALSRQILSATLYMHERGVCHRDLKLENVVYESRERDADVVVIDYGLSKVWEYAKGTEPSSGVCVGAPPCRRSTAGEYGVCHG